MIALCGVLAALLTVSTTASANGSLDQQQTATNSGVGSGGDVSLGQTFKAGLSGKLSEVEVFLYAEGAVSVQIQIRNVLTTGEPGTEVLADQTVQASGNNWQPIVFSSPAQVVSGTNYAIVTFQPTITGIILLWGGESGNPYPAGASWNIGGAPPPGGPWTPISTFDFAFKTYVEPPVPTSKEQCKDGGWKNFGTMFKNQGQCVKFVRTGR